MDRSALREKIRELEPNQPVTVPMDASVGRVIGIMQERKFGAVLVVDARGCLAGIFTERDVLNKFVSRNLDPEKTKVSQLMTANPAALTLDHSIAFAMNKMSVGGYRHVPIVGPDNKPVGIISVKDVVNFICEHYPQEILNLPPEPEAAFRDHHGA